jgi:mono/diheme cytochrome c family protein
MNKLQCFFAAASLFLAALVIALIFREYNAEWRPYQEEYKAFLQKTAATDTQKEAADRFPVSVRQDWLPEFNQADRCRSCHIGVDNPAAPQQEPVSPHPDLVGQHTFQKFGCTVCHAGDGYATRLPDAHEHLLPPQVVEAGCGKCHDRDTIKGEAPTFAAGQVLADRYNCNGCHQLAGRERRKYSGPDLNGLAVKVSPGWLVEWLKEPKKYLPRSRMGNFILVEEEIQALAGYLTSNTWQDKEQFFAGDKADQLFLDGLDDDAYDELIEEGKVLFGRLRCLTCHSLHGRGGTMGPELENIGSKTTTRWISAWLLSPSEYDSRTIMPTFRLTRAERLGIAEYLRLEGEDLDEDEDDAEDKTAPLFSTVQKKTGAKLFISRGCFNCHALNGVPDTGEFAPSLADLANKKKEKISFGSTQVKNTLPDYIAAKLQAPRIFGDNLKMPFFDLPLEEAGRLTTFALAQSSSIPPAYNQKTKSSDFAIGGEVGRLVDRYKCLSCHRIQGRGTTLAPDLSAEGSKVRKEWLIAYLQKPYAIRPTLPERMLRFNVSLQEATLLADYITIALRDRDVDEYLALTGNTNPETGKTLYYEKYNCQSCHAIGTGGGYFGPALDQVGSRLKPNWIHARLENGHRFEKESREPVLAIPEDDRTALVAFLSTLTGTEK